MPFIIRVVMKVVVIFNRLKPELQIWPKVVKITDASKEFRLNLQRGQRFQPKAIQEKDVNFKKGLMNKR